MQLAWLIEESDDGAVSMTQGQHTGTVLVSLDSCQHQIEATIHLRVLFHCWQREI